jgi:hypothetical protein
MSKVCLQAPGGGATTDRKTDGRTDGRWPPVQQEATGAWVVWQLWQQ